MFSVWNVLVAAPPARNEGSKSISSGNAISFALKPDPLISRFQSELTCWRRFKFCCQRKPNFYSGLRSILNQNNLPIDWQNTIVQALTSRDFAVYRIFLRRIILKLSPDDLKALSNAVCTQTIESLSTELLENFSTLLTTEEMQKLLNIPRDFDVTKTGDLVAKCNDKLAQAKPQKIRKVPGVIRILHGLIDTVLMAFSFFELGKEPGSSWEASHMLSLYAQMFAFPFTMVTMLNSLLLSPITSVMISGTVVLALITIVVVYVKWLKPCPEHLTLCHNLTADARDGKLNHIVGHEAVVKKMRDAFEMSSPDVTHHPIIVGPPGVGKTTAFQALALALYRAGSEFTVYRINASKLVPTGNAWEEDKTQKIHDRIGVKNKKRAILCFDEFQAALDNPVLNKALLSFFEPSEEGFPFCAAAMTSEGFSKAIAKSGKDDGWERRLCKIDITSSAPTDTFSILKNMATRNAEDLEISEKILHAIYEKTAKLPQPDRSKKILAKAIVKVREKRKAVDDSRLVAAKTRIHQIALAITELPPVDQLSKLQAELKEKEADVIRLSAEVAAERKKLQEVNDLIKFRIAQKKTVNRLSKEISSKDAEKAKKCFLMLYFSLVPALEKMISAQSPYTIEQALEEVYKEEALKEAENQTK